MEKITFRDLYIEASGNFLTEHLPNDFDFKAEDVEAFIEEHRCEFVEYWPVAEIEESIWNCADGYWQLLRKRGIEVEKSLEWWADENS